MLQRLTINLSQLERQALKMVAELDLRDIRDEARRILRKELVRRGLLPSARPGELTPELSGHLVNKGDDDGESRPLLGEGVAASGDDEKV